MTCINCANCKVRNGIYVCKENNYCEIRIDINEFNSCPYFDIKEE